MQVYRDARNYDAQYAAARHTLQAGMEKLPQGRALLLPTLNLSASVVQTYHRLGVQGPDDAARRQARFPQRWLYAHAHAAALPAAELAQYNQGELQMRQAEAQFGQASQDLILRVAQAYFDVLAAQDTLALVRAQKTAISEQLAQAKRNFEVGTATITDTHEAQARYDLSLAQEISAMNDVEARRRALQQLTGKEYASLKPLRAEIKLSPPNPNNMQDWVDLAEKQSYPVLVQEAGTEIAALEARRNRAGHYPTLDAVATTGQGFQTGSQLSVVGSDTTVSTIGLQLAWPLYQGGAISSREREAAANHERRARTWRTRAAAPPSARARPTSRCCNGVAQVRALEQALVSTQSALDSNRLGYEVGVRINIDVLNAQQQVFSTRRDLAVARYNTITNNLRLKAAAGSPARRGPRRGQPGAGALSRLRHTARCRSVAPRCCAQSLMPAAPMRAQRSGFASRPRAARIAAAASPA